jgi:hypothetical protein
MASKLSRFATPVFSKDSLRKVADLVSAAAN